ncbi:hypothetical protein DL765_008873 [Monosporascus sp. GIB2]|nr:hypothetical protein DL765_008873 [Monosporascus sp. GIB2]
MVYTGIPGEPTHRAGHVLDLVFSNIPFAETSVCDDLNSGSDHFTLLTVIPGRGKKEWEQYQLRVSELNLDRFADLIATGAASLPETGPVASPEELDSRVEAVTSVFQSAIEAIGKPAMDRGRRAPWWTQDCQNAYRTYRGSEIHRQLTDQGSPDQNYTDEHRQFLSVVRKAKRDYWRKITRTATTDDKLYKIISWHKLGSRLKSPPLRVGNKVIEDTLGKTEALRTEILERFTADDDLDYDPLGDMDQCSGQLPWDTTATLEEVEAHTIGASSTSPGTDGVTVRLLKAGWKPVKCVDRLNEQHP